MMPKPNNDPESGRGNRLILPAEINNLPHFISFVCKKAEELKFSAKRRLEIELVLEEALVNIMEYAYPADKPKELILSILNKDNNELHIEIRDRGVSFDPFDKSEPDLEADLMDRPIGGLGIVLIKELTDALSWHRDNLENCLSITFAKRHA